MKWITLFLFYLHSLQCQANDHSTATINHRQFSSQLHLDASGLPSLHRTDCECLTKVHLAMAATRSTSDPPIIPLGLRCRCQDCVAHDFDEQGNPNFHCRERNHDGPEKHRQKRAFNWEDLIGKISLMGSIDNQYSKKTQGYFHYNYGTTSEGPSEGGQAGKPTSTTKATTTTTTTAKQPETTVATE